MQLALPTCAPRSATTWSSSPTSAWTSTPTTATAGSSTADGEVDNDATLGLYERAAVAQADAGADVIAPSGMMDGQVAAIRAALDGAGHAGPPSSPTPPSTPQRCTAPSGTPSTCPSPDGGDRKGYQQDPANAREALEEIRADVAEGADVIMVKPALAYLDVIAAARAAVDLPLAAYHVSGEYAMVKAAAERGWIDGDAVALEHLTVDQAGRCRHHPHLLRQGPRHGDRPDERGQQRRAVRPGAAGHPRRGEQPGPGLRQRRAARPYFVARAEGAHVWDAEGPARIDLVQSYGAIIAGHAHPAIVEAIQRAAVDGTSYGAPTAREVLLAEAICERVPSVRDGAPGVVGDRGHHVGRPGGSRAHWPATRS